MCEAFCRKSRRPPPARHFSAAGTGARSDAQEGGRKDGKTQRTRRERREHGNATRSTNRRTLRREREARRRKTAGASPPPPPPLRLSYANRARKRKRNLNRPASAESLARRLVAAPAARFRRGNARRARPFFRGKLEKPAFNFHARNFGEAQECRIQLFYCRLARVVSF